MNNFPVRLLAGVLMTLALFVLEGQAAIRTVDNTTDNSSLSACTAAANDCSLRGAITDAQAGDDQF